MPMKTSTNAHEGRVALVTGAGQGIGQAIEQPAEVDVNEIFCGPQRGSESENFESLLISATEIPATVLLSSTAD
jgi:hypothetical protein